MRLESGPAFTMSCRCSQSIRFRSCFDPRSQFELSPNSLPKQPVLCHLVLPATVDGVMDDGSGSHVVVSNREAFRRASCLIHLPIPGCAHNGTELKKSMRTSACLPLEHDKFYQSVVNLLAKLCVGSEVAHAVQNCAGHLRPLTVIAPGKLATKPC